jgi:hypothetical protein
MTATILGGAVNIADCPAFTGNPYPFAVPAPPGVPFLEFDSGVSGVVGVRARAPPLLGAVLTLRDWRRGVLIPERERDMEEVVRVRENEEGVETLGEPSVMGEAMTWGSSDVDSVHWRWRIMDFVAHWRRRKSE